MKEKFLELWASRKKMTIRRKLLVLVLACSVLSLLILSAITLYGMAGIRAEAIESGEVIGALAAQRSSLTLENEKQAHLISLAQEKAENIDLLLSRISDSVKVLQWRVTRIIERPWEYPMRRIAEPRRGDGGEYMAWVFYSPKVLDRAALSEEIGLMANAQDLLVEIARLIGDGESATPYIASASGFIFEADNELPAWCFPNPYIGEPATFDFTERPWFQRSRDTGELFFTEPYFGARDGGLAISCAAPYFRNGIFAGVVGIGASLKSTSHAVLNTELGEDGFCFVLDGDGHVIFSQQQEGVLAVNRTLSDDLRQAADKSLALAARRMTWGEQGVVPVVLDGTAYYLAFAPIKETGWSFGVAVDASNVTKLLNANRAFIEEVTDEQISDINGYMRRTIFMLIFATILIMAAVIIFGSKFSIRLTNPLLQLSDNVREIASGNLEKHIDIKTGDEIEHLAACFNAMTADLKTYMKNLTQVTAERERIATELNVAKDIQLAMLPHDFDFGRDDFEIFATTNAAKMVGGDFYDFYLLDENHLAITVADVSGKGIPASLFMVISKTVLKNFATFATEADNYAAVVSCANDQLCQGNDEMMFVTVFFGVLEIDSGRFIFVNGGHNPPVIYRRAENRCEYLDVKKNFVLGGMDGVPYKQQEINLGHGDLIFAYTDGVNEAMNENHEEYTSARLLNFMNATDCTADLKKLLENVRADVAKHVGGAEQSDDITMMALRRT